MPVILVNDILYMVPINSGVSSVVVYIDLRYVAVSDFAK